MGVFTTDPLSPLNELHQARKQEKSFDRIDRFSAIKKEIKASNFQFLISSHSIAENPVNPVKKSSSCLLDAICCFEREG
jgi:hypothetical protein